MEQDEILEKAMDVFIHYGFKKASMDDVAQAVGISRQAIYKRFSNKTELFRTVIEYCMKSSSEAATAALHDEKFTPKERLVNSCYCWGGQFIDQLRSSPHSHEVFAMANAEMHETAKVIEHEFNEAGATMLVKNGVCSDHRFAKNVMFTLEMASKGLMHWGEGEAHYMESIKTVVDTLLPASSA